MGWTEIQWSFFHSRACPFAVPKGSWSGQSMCRISGSRQTLRKTRNEAPSNTHNGPLWAHREWHAKGRDIYSGLPGTGRKSICPLPSWTWWVVSCRATFLLLFWGPMPHASTCSNPLFLKYAGRSAAVVFAWLISRDPDADLQQLNKEFCLIRNVRKTLWQQKNIKEFHRRLQLRNVGTAATTAGETEDEEDDNIYNKKKEL